MLVIWKTRSERVFNSTRIIINFLKNRLTLYVLWKKGTELLFNAYKHKKAFTCGTYRLCKIWKIIFTAGIAHIKLLEQNIKHKSQFVRRIIHQLHRNKKKNLCSRSACVFALWTCMKLYNGKEYVWRTVTFPLYNRHLMCILTVFIFFFCIYARACNGDCIS